MSPSVLVATDLNGDGASDLLAATNTGLSWFTSVGGKGELSLQELVTDQTLKSIATADIDGDFDIDALALDSASRIIWFENSDGLGSLVSQNELFPTPGVVAALLARDLDNDQDVDILISSEQNLISWYDNIDNQSTFEIRQSISAPKNGRADITTGDIDGDGDIDIVSASVGGVFWYENLGQRFREVPRANQVIYASPASAPVLSDVDIDGDLDLFLNANNSQGHRELVWFENVNGEGGFESRDTLPLSEGTNRHSLADLDGDGDADIVSLTPVPDSNVGDVFWRENATGKGSFSEPEKIIGDVLLFTTGDFNRDGDHEIVAVLRDSTLIRLEYRLTGDANDNGVFDSDDLIAVLKAAEYEDGIADNSTFEEGDWNGDGDFDSRDLIVAFATGTYGSVTYPRLFFGPEDIPKIQSRVQEKMFSRSLRRERESALNLLDKDYSDPELYERIKATEAAHIAFLVIALKDDDPHKVRFVEKAREILLNINVGLWPGYAGNLVTHRVDWDGSTDTHPWFTGNTLMDYSIAYDWLAGTGNLSAAERQDIRFRLLRLAQMELKTISTPMHLLSRDFVFRHANYMFRGLTAVGIVALTFPDQKGLIADPWNRVEPKDKTPFNSSDALNWVMRELFDQITVAPPSNPTSQSLIEHYVSAEGVYAEGFTYQRDAFGIMTPFLVSYHRNTGIDLLSADGPTDGRLAEMYTTNLRVMLPNKDRPTYGDSFWGRAYPWHEMMAAYTVDPAASHWFVENVVSPGIGRSMLSYRENTQEPLPAPNFRTEFFPDAGMAVFRDKWGADATYLMLNASGRSVYGHNQADQGSLMLYANEAYMIVDPGYGRAYKYEPDHRWPGGKWDWITSALGHSGVTVDSIYTVNETPNKSLKNFVHPRILKSYEEQGDPGVLQNPLAARDIDYAEARITYVEKNAELLRTVAFPRHRYFILDDRLSAQENHDYGWQLQLGATETGTFNGDNGDYLWLTPNRHNQEVGLGITMLDSNREVNVYTNGPTNLEPNPGDIYDRTYILAQENAQETRYITLLDPHETADERIEVETLVEGKAWKVIHAPNAYDVIVSQTDSRSISVDEITSNAQFLVASIDLVKGEKVLRSLVAKGGSHTSVDYQQSQVFDTDSNQLFHYETTDA